MIIDFTLFHWLTLIHVDSTVVGLLSYYPSIHTIIDSSYVVVHLLCFIFTIARINNAYPLRSYADGNQCAATKIGMILTLQASSGNQDAKFDIESASDVNFTTCRASLTRTLPELVGAGNGRSFYLSTRSKLFSGLYNHIMLVETRLLLAFTHCHWWPQFSP